MFFIIFFLKCNIINIKIICFLLAHFNIFFSNYLFFKFINKCQKEILKCVPPSSHVCDFFDKGFRFPRNKVLKTFKIFTDCHVKHADLSNGRLFLKSLVPLFSRTYALSVRFKMKPLRKSVFKC